MESWTLLFINPDFTAGLDPAHGRRDEAQVFA
jgi:hypothetical protein